MFTVEDLKAGMLVKLYSGKYGIILPAHNNGELCIIVQDCNTGRLGIGTATLRFYPKVGVLKDYSIIRVYDLAPDNRYDFMKPGARKLLWDSSIREMTLEEVENELGYSIKIVEEH